MTTTPSLSNLLLSICQQEIMPNFIAVTPDRKNLVGCHNLASARSYASGRLPDKKAAVTSYTYNATPYQAPSGQFYVIIHAGSQEVRMDVANVGTARYYAKHGVDTELTFQAYAANCYPLSCLR